MRPPAALVLAAAALAAAACATPIATVDSQSGAGVKAIRSTGTNIARRKWDSHWQAAAEGIRGMDKEAIDKLKATGGSAQPPGQVQGRQLPLRRY